jgi:hypothetical protein
MLRALLLALLLAACAPREVKLEGRVVDAESGAPVPGALLRLDAAVACRTNQGVERDAQPRRYLESDGEGRFAFPAEEIKPACWSHELWGELRARAPGYAAVQERDLFGRPAAEVSSGLIGLRRLDGRSGTGVPGRLASVAGASFQRLAWTREGLVLAEDRQGGRVHAWGPSGAPVELPLPDGLELVGIYHRPDRGYPLVGLGGRLFVTDEPSRWLELRVAAGAIRGAVESQGQLVTLESDGRAIGIYDTRALSRPLRTVGLPAGGVRDLAEVVSGAEGRGECLAALPGPGRRPVLVVRVGGQRRLVTLRAPESRGSPAVWAVLPTGPGALPGEVVACGGGRHALYVLTRAGYLFKVERPGGKDPSVWEATRWVHIAQGGGPVAVGAVAVGDPTLRPEAVHVVTGDDTVYRFDEDLIPD